MVYLSYDHLLEAVEHLLGMKSVMSVMLECSRHALVVSRALEQHL